MAAGERRRRWGRTSLQQNSKGNTQKRSPGLAATHLEQVVVRQAKFQSHQKPEDAVERALDRIRLAEGRDVGVHHAAPRRALRREMMLLLLMWSGFIRLALRPTAGLHQLRATW
jgi:hypothetical protein